MQVNLASEMNVLARRFHRLSMSGGAPATSPSTACSPRSEQVIAAFPVYRTYVSERGAGADDRRYIDWAIAQAKKQAARQRHQHLRLSASRC